MILLAPFLPPPPADNSAKERPQSIQRSSTPGDEGSPNHNGQIDLFLLEIKRPN